MEDSLDPVRGGDQGGWTDRTAVNGSRKGGERGRRSNCAHAHAQKIPFLTHAHMREERAVREAAAGKKPAPKYTVFISALCNHG